MTRTRLTAVGTPMAGPAEAMPLRFLVVDDDEDIRALLVRMVERLGHVADHACDGAVAVAMLEERAYDLMLLDMTMPRMGGEDVLRWLAERPSLAPGLRVVVVSAWASPQRTACEHLGAWGALRKPLRLHQLRELVSVIRAECAHPAS